MRILSVILSAAMLVMAQSLTAEVAVVFSDGAPEDRFTIINTGCAFTDAVLVIDMRSSANNALIDTEYGGLGTQDPLPVVVETGDLALPDITDGTQVLHVFVASLGEGESASLTLDLDDADSPSYGDRISVSGRDIAGSRVSLTIDNETRAAVMNDRGIAKVETPPTAQGCMLT